MTIESFIALVNLRGSDVLYHRDDSMIPCPCRTPEGFRDPEWHLANPSAPVCNASGMLPGSPVHMIVKGFVQPAQSGRSRNFPDEYITQMFGTVEADDHLGIFPISWNSIRLDFYEWGQSGEDYIEYNGRRFICISASLIPDPITGNPEHHWEVGLRLSSRVPVS